MKTSLLLIAALFYISFSALALEMNPKELPKLTKGELIKDVKWRDKFVWPKVTMRALIPGTPEQNMKNFIQFDKHTTFIPDLVKSKITKTLSPTQLHVQAELKVPWPVNKSAYTTNNVITTEADGTQKLTWNLVEGDLIKATDGHIIFTPYEGKSLMEYQSQIVPDSGFAGMFKNKVTKDVEKSVKAIVKFLGKELPKN